MAGATTIDPERVSASKAATSKQVYKIAHLALEALGREWPSSRRDASMLITELELEGIARVLANFDDAWQTTG